MALPKHKNAVTPTLSDDAESPLAIDVSRLIETRLLVQANSGGGKSWVLRRILEQTHGMAQHIVLDPDGEYHTLREKYDYVLAGRGGDCPAEVKSAGLLARRLLELGCSAIIDISELGASRAAFVEKFLEAMMDVPRDLWHDVIVALDEAHKFCPEGDRHAVGHAAVVDLMSRGRKRGFCGILATQRISKLDKSAAAEVNNRLIGRTALDVDVKRAAVDLGISLPEAMKLLPYMKAGEFYGYGPALAPRPTLVKVGGVVTTHPKAGTRGGLPTPPREHVRKVLEQLADLPAEAEEEAKTVEQLRKRVRELESAKSPVAVSDAHLDKLEGMIRHLTAERDVLREHLATSARWEKSLDDQLEKVSAELGSIADLAIAARNSIVDAAEDHVVAEQARPKCPPHEYVGGDFQCSKCGHYDASRDSRVRPTPLAGADDNGLSNMETAMLTALAQHRGGLPKAKILLHANYSAGGATSKCFATIVREGWAAPGGPGLVITDAGLTKLGRYTPLPTGTRLQRFILSGSRLSDMEKKLLEVICLAYPEKIGKREVLKHAGYAAGGATSAAFARLVAFDYAKSAGPNFLIAAEELFD